MAVRIIGRALRGRRAGRHKLAWNHPATRTRQTFSLVSPAFADGDLIPARYSGGAENVSPPLKWSGVPAHAVELVLIVEDPDAPTPRPFVHCVARGIRPDLGKLAEGALAPDGTRADVVLARGGLRHVGYVGPRPIPGHGPHEYVFQLFALDRRLNVGPRTSPRQLLAAMQGRVIARAQLTGVYERA